MKKKINLIYLAYGTFTSYFILGFPFFNQMFLLGGKLESQLACDIIEGCYYKHLFNDCDKLFEKHEKQKNKGNIIHHM